MVSPVIECTVLLPCVLWGGRRGGRGRGGRGERERRRGTEGKGTKSNWRKLSINKLHEMKITGDKGKRRDSTCLLIRAD